MEKTRVYELVEGLLYAAIALLRFRDDAGAD
jgi:hypothetical protein